MLLPRTKDGVQTSIKVTQACLIAKNQTMIHAIRPPKIYTLIIFVFPSSSSASVSENFKSNFLALSHRVTINYQVPTHLAPNKKIKRGLCGAYRLVSFFENKRQKHTAKEKFRFSVTQKLV